MLETQICQLVQQVATSSQPNETFPGQTETNPKCPINVITHRDGKELEDPVVETKKNEVEKESNEPQELRESDEPNDPPPNEPNISFPQGFDKSQLNEQFRKFIEIIQDKLPPKLMDPGSFSIPCVIGSEIIERAMCDLGASVSLMSLSLSERLGIR